MVESLGVLFIRAEAGAGVEVGAGEKIPGAGQTRTGSATVIKITNIPGNRQVFLSNYCLNSPA